MALIAPELNSGSYIKWAMQKWAALYAARLNLFDTIHGELTTRTDADTGVITVVSDSNAGHGITTADTLDVFFDDGTTSGEISGMSVTSVTNKAITVDGGSGADLPVVNSLVTVKVVNDRSTILPIGDPHQGKPDAATFKTVGELQADGTWAEDTSWRTFDGHDTLTDSATFPYKFQGSVVVVDFNASDEHVTFLDSSYFTRSIAPFSVCVWMAPSAAAPSTLLSKWDATTDSELREWRFVLDSSARLEFLIYDETNNAQLGRRYSVATVPNIWQFVVVTYDGATDNNGMNIYLNAVVVDDTNVNASAGSFVQMQDTAVIPRLGALENSAGNITSFFGGLMAGGPLGPAFIPRELTADEVRRDYDLGRKALGL